MPRFTSRRERRLWLWTLAVVAAIYFTLGLTRPLAGALRERGLLEASFALGMLLVGATILLQGFKARSRGRSLRSSMTSYTAARPRRSASRHGWRALPASRCPSPWRGAPTCIGSTR